VRRHVLLDMMTRQPKDTKTYLYLVRRSENQSRRHGRRALEELAMKTRCFAGSATTQARHPKHAISIVPGQLVKKRMPSACSPASPLSCAADDAVGITLEVICEPADGNRRLFSL